MAFTINITKRLRKRKQLSGHIVKQLRYVVSYRDPRTGRRRQEFFERHKDAQARRSDLIFKVGTGAYVDKRTAPTVSEAIDHWLADKEGKVKASTLDGYNTVVERIRGPLLIGTRQERINFTTNGRKPPGARLLPMLGKHKVTDLTTAEIRSWHRQVCDQCGAYTGNRAASHLKSILALAEEDFGGRAPSMPNNLARGRHRVKKEILSPQQIGRLIQAAKSDKEHGVYYAFPFLAGTRPSEQLGLLWEDVDFDKNLIRIQRIQERDGSLTGMTKTEAGTREIPMCGTLRELLLEWRVRCPRNGKELHRVFPGPGRLEPWPARRTGGGGPLRYQNFRLRYWKPIFDRLGLPYVTPHSARHSFISVLQAQGIEVGLVAKLAGHANPTVTLGHYTQAVRGGDEAVNALEAAYVGA